MGQIFPFIFIGFCAIVVLGAFYFFKNENSRLFTEKYSQLISEYGKPLKEFSFLSGWLGPNVIPYEQFRGLIKLSVYIDKLLVTVWGNSLCVPYEQGQIRSVEQKGLDDYLVIENVSVPAGIYKFLPPIARRNKPSSAPLSICLPQKDIDFIISLVHKVNSKN